MKNKIFLTLASILTAASMLAQDFTYQGVKYTVLDASAKTVTTKAGTDNNHGNHDLAGSIVIPETVYDESNNAYTVTQIGDYSLTNNTEITELKLPKTLTSIGQFGLYGCGMEVLILPKSVESISYGGLSSCNNLTTLVIEGNPLFYVFSVNGSYNISSIYCLSDTPPTFQAGAGGAFSNLNATVYVSAENLSTYQNNAEWKKFANIEVGSYEIPTEPEQPASGNVFRYVADLAELGTVAGDKAEVVFVAPNGTKAMSTEIYADSNNKKTGLASTSNFTDNGDGTITVGDDVAVITMKCVSYNPPYSNYYTFEMMNGDNRGFMVGSNSSIVPEMSFTSSESGATEMIADLGSTLGDGSTGYRFYYNRSATSYNYLVYNNEKFQFTGSYTGQSYNEAFKIYVREAVADEPAVNAPMHLMISAGEAADLSSFFADVEVDSWASSDDNIAAVANGIVTGQQYGNAVVTARKADGSAWADIKVMVCPMLTVAYPEGALTSHLVPYGSPIDIDLTPLGGWSFCTASIDGRDISAQVDIDGHLFSHTTMTQDKLVNIATAKTDNPAWADGIRIIVDGRDVSITGADTQDNVVITNYNGEKTVYDWNVKEIPFGEGGVYNVKITHDGQDAFFRMVIE